MRSAILLIMLATATSVCADVLRAMDDNGHNVQLTKFPQRLVSLAPHVTELLYAAGAGNRIVGVVEYSDFPTTAREIPRVGSYSRIDLERVLALKPDLVVAWASGNHRGDLDRLAQLGIPLFVTDPRKLDDVASNLERLGELIGSPVTARRAAMDFRGRRQALQKRYSTRTTVRMFYEIWNQPLMTVNGEHVLSDVMQLCGGENVFASQALLAPSINVEAVLNANPEVIVASGMDEKRPEWLDDWRRFPGLTAVRRNNLFFIPPDLLQRHTPRLLDGAEQLCGALETARTRR